MRAQTFQDVSCDAWRIHAWATAHTRGITGMQQWR